MTSTRTTTPSRTAISPTVDSRSLYRRVWTLAWPIAGSNFLLRGAGIADTMMVGHLGGMALAGVGLAQVMLFMALAVPRGIGIGGQVMVAFYTGQANPDKRREMAAVAVLLGAISTIVLSVVGYLFLDDSMRLLGGSPDVIAAAHSYLAVYLVFFTFGGLMFVFSAIFQGAGDSRTPLYVTIGVNAIHIVVAVGLIFGRLGFPQLGIAGAAWASGITELGGVIVLAVMAHKRGLWSPSRSLLASSAFREVWGVAHSAIAERLLVTGMISVFTRLLMYYGAAAYATTRVGIDMEAFAFLPALGFAQAATTLVGQHLGAGEPREARRAGWATANICLVFMSVMGLSYFFFGDLWMRLFTNDPAVLERATTFGRIAAVIQIPLAYAIALAGALRGAGETRWVMFGPVIGGWAIRLPLALAMVYLWDYGIVALWWTMPMDWFIRGVWMIGRFRHGHFRLERERANQQPPVTPETTQHPPRETGI